MLIELDFPLKTLFSLSIYVEWFSRRNVAYKSGTVTEHERKSYLINRDSILKSVFFISSKFCLSDSKPARHSITIAFLKALEINHLPTRFAQYVSPN